MSIFVDENTRLLVQGITGREGEYHTKQCIYYGSNVVAGVTPGKGGERMREVPVFETVGAAVAATGANCSLLFVPPLLAAEAIMEAIDAELPLIVAVSAGIPLLDMMRIRQYLRGKSSRLLGPNTPGIITPGRCKVGIMPGPIFKPGGPLGVISSSGSLLYEVVSQLTQLGWGQTTCVGIGRDPLVGTGFAACLAAFAADPATRGIVLIGEPDAEMAEVAEYVEKQVGKPVLAYLAGLSALPPPRREPANALVNGRNLPAAVRVAALRQAGVAVCEDLAALGAQCRQVFAACAP